MAEQLLGQMGLFDYIEEPAAPKRLKNQKLDILTYLNTGSKHAIKRKWLCYKTKLSDRSMRDMLHEARKKIPVFNLQNGNGYFIPDMNLDNDKRMLVRWVKQEQSRIKESQLCVDAAIKTLDNCGVDWR